MIADRIDKNSSVYVIAETIKDVFTKMVWEYKIDRCILPAMEIWNEINVIVK